MNTILDNYYNSVLSAKNDKSFFIALDDYVKYVLGDEALMLIVSRDLEEKKKSAKKLNKFRNKSIEEIYRVKKILLERVKKNDLYKENIKEEFEEFDNHIGGKIASSAPLVTNLNDSIGDIIDFMDRAGRRDLIEEFILPIKSNPAVFKYNFSENYELFEQERAVYLSKKDISMWGVWDNLNYSHIIINEGVENTVKFKNREKDFFSIWKLKTELLEWENIKDGKPLESSNPIFFNRADFDGYISRFHNYLLSKSLNETEVKTLSHKATYKDGLLNLNDKKIIFNVKDNQGELLTTLFKDVKREWNYDEIQEEWDKSVDSLDLPDNYWRKFYNAGDGINTKIAIKTQIEDYIIKDTKTIKINPKYI